jgi:MinD-like ATPase involved in chromosome partitioning or flagellar assembly
MALIALGSVHASPGVTTTALALAAVWQRSGRQPFLLEADPDGGVIAARFGLGHHPSLSELGAAARSGLATEDVWQHAQHLPGGLAAVVAHPSAEQSGAALRTGGPRLGERFANLAGYDVLADVGRLRAGTPAAGLIERAAVVIVVLRPHLDEIDVLSARLSSLDQRGNVGLVFVGARPYRPAEVAVALGVELLGVVAHDARSAATLAGAGGSARALRRLPLLRSARTLAIGVAARLDDVEHSAERPVDAPR